MLMSDVTDTTQNVFKSLINVLVNTWIPYPAHLRRNLGFKIFISLLLFESGPFRKQYIPLYFYL